MHSLPKLTFLLAVFSLAGCAAHEPIVTSRGALPQGGTYQILGQETPSRARDLVSTRLARLGFTRSDTPDYLVQIGASERPAAVGTLVPDPEEQQWLRSPSPRSSRFVRGMTVSVTERGNGHELYRATAEVRGKRGAPEQLEPLIATLLAPHSHADRPAAH